MTAEPNKTRRFRFRFSLRTLFIFMTLVGAYFGAWEVTKLYGLNSSGEVFDYDERSPAPFIIARDEVAPGSKRIGRNRILYGDFRYRRYYLWLFGPRFRLPFEGKTELQRPIIYPPAVPRKYWDSPSGSE